MNWPQQAKVAQTTAKNATTIRKAFNQAFNADAITAAWIESHPDKESMTPQGARDWSLAHVQYTQKPIQLALSRTYADSYVLGDRIAAVRVLGMMATKALTAHASAGVVDWSTWVPGSSSAAALVNPKGGLKQLLDTRRITVANEVTRTKLDRIGTALHTSLEGGYSADRTARLINEVINDPQHALVIARTETSRAMSVATRERYESNNVQQVEWLVAEGCDICQENADASPIGIDETFPTGDSEPPAHPNCMCAIAPVFDDSDLPAAEEIDAEQDFEPVNTSSDISEYYEEITDSMEADQLSRFQNYDDELIRLLGLDKDGARIGDSLKWDKDVLTAEGFALDRYKLTDYQDINDYLRFGAKTITSERRRELVAGYIKSIDKVMEVAPPLPKPIMTYRGVVLGENNFIGQLKTGDVFEDKGFGSTSMYKEFSKDWTTNKYGAWLIEIENPAGTKGLMLDGLKYQRALDEAEWLLPRGTKFEVMATDNINNTIKVRVKND